MKEFFEKLLRPLMNERGEVGPRKPEAKEDVGLDDELGGFADDEGEGEGEGEGDVEIDLDDEEYEDEDEEEEEDTRHPAQKRLDKEKQKLKEDNERLQRQVQELNEMRAQPQQMYTPPPVHMPQASDPANWTKAQWDKLAADDWQAAVDLRAEIKAKEQYANISSAQSFERSLEDAKVKVLSRHPELGEETSEKSKIYRNIVNANPEYVNMKEGPLFAMYKMEEFMEKNMGYKREDIVRAETKARTDEQSRLNRVQVMSTTGRSVTEGNKVVLTKDERDFCEMQGINPKVYATNKKKLSASGRGGIQL